MDKYRVLQIVIPDMAVVYGGVRGRTLSSRHLADVRKALAVAGISQVIDLRQDYTSDRYSDICEMNGMKYFHYPVHRNKETVANMVKDFATFCELIDRGDFFISCVQRLHRTDIALCTYWVFHGADKGKEPPVLVGYLEEKGHDAHKIFEVLNSFYRILTEHNGKEPMTMEVFKERKGIIHNISQNMYTIQDRIRGSLIGGAIGDALGYPVEFVNSHQAILNRYGQYGITRFDTSNTPNGKAVISDDTQMTLFTACGLLNAPKLGVEPKFVICRAYLEWLETQTGKHRGKAECWIRNVPELNQRRAPGNTCITSLDAIRRGYAPINNSKGCGGVMRIVPIPLYAVVDDRMSIEDADRLAGDAAEITHQHPLGFIPATLMSHVIYRLALDVKPTVNSMKSHIMEGIDSIHQMYDIYQDDAERMAELAEQAILLIDNDKTDVENIAILGEGWVAEETLAIALYCTLKHFDSFEGAIIAAVNHGGDSDSTGAVTGNIIGTIVGYDAIPDFFKKDLEMHDLILHMADDLYRGEITKL